MSKFGEMNALAAGGRATRRWSASFCRRQRRPQHRDPHHHRAAELQPLPAGRGGLALPQSSLLPIANGSDTYGLHPSLPEIQGLYNQGKAAVLANVGMLVQPHDRAAYLTNNTRAGARACSRIPTRPPVADRHSDGTGSTGWGGRIADLLQSQNAGAIFPPVTSTSGCGLFCTGAQTSPATVPPHTSGSTRATGMATLNGLQNAAPHRRRHAAIADLRQRTATGAGRQRHHDQRQQLRQRR